MYPNGLRQNMTMWPSFIAFQPLFSEIPSTLFLHIVRPAIYLVIDWTHDPSLAVSHPQVTVQKRRRLKLWYQLIITPSSGSLDPKSSHRCSTRWQIRPSSQHMIPLNQGKAYAGRLPFTDAPRLWEGSRPRRKM